jgi:hypothetical protein
MRSQRRQERGCMEVAHAHADVGAGTQDHGAPEGVGLVEEQPNALFVGGFRAAVRQQTARREGLGAALKCCPLGKSVH